MSERYYQTITCAHCALSLYHAVIVPSFQFDTNSEFAINIHIIDTVLHQIIFVFIIPLQCRQLDIHTSVPMKSYIYCVVCTNGKYFEWMFLFNLHTSLDVTLMLALISNTPHVRMEPAQTSWQYWQPWQAHNKLSTDEPVQLPHLSFTF